MSNNSNGVNYYRTQKIKKPFPAGKHAKLVGLTDKGLVKKSYHTGHKDIFEHEVNALKTLQPCKFVPRLHFVDEEKRTIYMSYCGKPLQNFNTRYRTKIKKYKKIMEEDFGIYHNDIREGNILLHGNQVYFIDFGWARNYPGIAGYGKGKIGDPDMEKVTEIVEKPKFATKQDLLSILLSIHISNELKSDYLIQKIKEILLQEQLIKENNDNDNGNGNDNDNDNDNNINNIMVEPTEINDLNNIGAEEPIEPNEEEEYETNSSMECEVGGNNNFLNEDDDED